MQKSAHPLSLFQLLIELIKGLVVFMAHVSQHLLMGLGLILQSPLQLSYLRLSLSSEMGRKMTGGQLKLWRTGRLDIYAYH